MCGIFGTICFKEEGFNEDMAIAIQNGMEFIQTRGRDAFGYYVDPANIKAKAVGFVSDYHEESKEKRKNDITDDCKNQRVFLGHTRYQTTSSPSVLDNNHPFETKDFVLAHNGTICNHEKIREIMKIDEKAPLTDSFVIVYLIQKFYNTLKKNGKFKKEEDAVKEAITRTVSQLEGGYSCWLFHLKSGTVFLFKSKNSDLELGFSEKLKTLFFASESRYFKEATEDMIKDEEETSRKNLKSLFENGEELKCIDMDSESGIITIKPYLNLKEGNVDENAVVFDKKDWERKWSSYISDYSDHKHNSLNNNKDSNKNESYQRSLEDDEGDEDEKDDSLDKESRIKKLEEEVKMLFGRTQNKEKKGYKKDKKINKLADSFSNSLDLLFKLGLVKDYSYESDGSFIIFLSDEYAEGYDSICKLQGDFAPSGEHNELIVLQDDFKETTMLLYTVFIKVNPKEKISKVLKGVLRKYYKDKNKEESEKEEE